jgi:hypothetical protein
MLIEAPDNICDKDKKRGMFGFQARSTRQPHRNSTKNSGQNG